MACRSRCAPGEVFALLGPNGAGKTTLLKILLGIIRSSGGAATLLGFPAGDRRGRRKVGYLPEHLRIPPHHTSVTALDYYGSLSGLSPAEIRSRRDGLLDRVGLAGRDRESVKRFSKGMRQRLGLAQALLHDPEVLILDEPTDGLDPVGRSEVRRILTELRAAGKTVFLNSHLLQEVELVCDRVAILHQGRLRFVGALDELRPAGEGELQLTLQGSPEQLSTAIPNWQPDPGWTSEQPVTVVIPVASQAAADATVDRLRATGISIIRLSWRGQTLEDAFLRMIDESPTLAQPVHSS